MNGNETILEAVVGKTYSDVYAVAKASLLLSEDTNQANIFLGRRGKGYAVTLNTDSEEDGWVKGSKKISFEETETGEIIVTKIAKISENAYYNLPEDLYDYVTRN